MTQTAAAAHDNVQEMTLLKPTQEIYSWRILDQNKQQVINWLTERYKM